MSKRRKLTIPRDATREQQLKIVADHIYTCAEAWIQACADSDAMLSEFVWRVNGEQNPIGLLRPPQR